MPWLALAAAAAPVVMGAIGNQQAAGARKNAEDDAKRALEAIQGVNLPDTEKMRLALEKYQSVGNLAPQMEGASTLGDTNLSNIALDPKYSEYTQSALRKMAEVSDKGLTEVDRAQLQGMLGQNASQNQANQKAILENRAARGMSGSGDELAAQLASSQSSANRGSNEAMQMAALAAQRKMDATSGLSNMVQQAQNADYQRQAQLQSQKDAIAQFNANQQQGVTTRNTSAGNNAQLMNLQNQQNIANQNTQLSNQQQQYNRGLEQQNFNNAMSKAGGVSQGYQNMSNFNQGQANATANQYAQVGSGIGGAIGAFGGASKMGGAEVPTTGNTAENLAWENTAKKRGGPF